MSQLLNELLFFNNKAQEPLKVEGYCLCGVIWA